MDKDARFKSIQVSQSLFKPVSKFEDVEAIYNDVDEPEVPVDVELGLGCSPGHWKPVLCTYFIVFIFRFLTCQYIL